MGMILVLLGNVFNEIENAFSTGLGWLITFCSDTGGNRHARTQTGFFMPESVPSCQLKHVATCVYLNEMLLHIHRCIQMLHKSLTTVLHHIITAVCSLCTSTHVYQKRQTCERTLIILHSHTNRQIHFCSPLLARDVYN